MKQLSAILAVLLAATAALAADKFWEQLTPAERAAAGLDQLTAEQQAALDRLAERYVKEGARQAVEVAKVRAKEEGKAEAMAVVMEKKKTTIGLAPREDDETEVVRARIDGDFRGWTGHTTFRLDNGQVWQQDASDSRFFPLMLNPEVEIRPAKLGGWKLTLLKEGLWIHVKRIH